MRHYLISDECSITKKNLLFDALSANLFLIDLGEIPTTINAGDDKIIETLMTLAQQHNCSFVEDCIIAISSTGNGVQIYANKIDGVFAASCFNEEMIAEAVDELNCHICDLPALYEENIIKELALVFVTRLKNKVKEGNFR